MRGYCISKCLKCAKMPKIKNVSSDRFQDSKAKIIYLNLSPES